MDRHYLAWAFRRSIIATLLYVIVCLLIWIALGARDGIAAITIAALTWGMYFSVYIKDRRIQQRYYLENKQSDDCEDG